MLTKLRRRIGFVVRGEMGSTLIKSLIVIAVLGILVGIVIFKFGGVRDEKNEASLKALGSKIKTSMTLYYAQKGEYPASEDINNFSDLATTIESLGIMGISLEAPAVLDTETGITYKADADQYLIELPSNISNTIYYVGAQGVGTNATDATRGGRVGK